jgi:AcrR family transcriptional regulator
MRITKDPEIRKGEIIEAAKVLFESKGIKKTSINEIANRIGVAKGLVYYYFSSKEELIEAVVEDFIEGVDEQLKSIMENDNLDFYLKLRAILDFYFNSIQNHPAISSYSPGNPGMFSLIRDRLSNIALFHAQDLIIIGLKQDIIKIKYPEYMLDVIIRGLGDLYIKGVTDPEIHTILVEQLLGLEEDTLSLG